MKALRLGERIYFRRESKISYKPTELSLIKREGNYTLLRQMFGPRGGIFMEERITLTSDEMKNIYMKLCDIFSGESAGESA